MRVSIQTPGMFHLFALARELEQRGLLAYILSTYPWFRLQKEGLPRSRVHSCPWVQTPYMLLHRTPFHPVPLMRALEAANARLLNRRAVALLKRSPEVDTLIALSGAATPSGKLLQQRGGTWICDRGSAHIRFTERILLEEYARWGVNITPHDEGPARRDEAEYHAADYVTVPSSFAFRTFVECGVPRERLRLIPYGVNLKNFTPAPQPPDNDEFRVLFAGALSLRKGIPYLLQAFAALKHPRKRLRLAGMLQHDLRPVLAQLPTENCEFLGHQPQSELVRLMQQSHCLVLPSLEEGLALVQAQALACGCPVIATPNSGSEDLFTSGIEGILVPPRDVTALTAAMQQFVDDPGLQHRMRDAALRRVLEMGGWSQYGQMWADFLRNPRATPAVAPPDLR